ncbi:MULTISPECIES: CCDC90 family protein [unclassified Endozoicomonas]|uniref:CCDC90 family protein n=1 Tax=unclassified Endozoicomonas TaxID=2644528 RepID=UPI0021476707|nr:MULTISPECIES: CCDC90 family protein [unclassified Endozoicomonas]
MEKSLFSELKRIGIDEELASKVSASLDPEYNASKKDVLVMQEAIMQVQLQSERSYQALSSEISSLRSEVHKEIAGVRAEITDVRTEITDFRAQITDVRTEITDVRTEIADVRFEMGSINRQYIITFLGLITTIVSVFAINWYFH